MSDDEYDEPTGTLADDFLADLDELDSGDEAEPDEAESAGDDELDEAAANRGVIDLDAMRDGRPQPVADQDGYHLYRIGDVAGSRDIHCAILDALRLCAEI